jgi:hypothetical protein
VHAFALLAFSRHPCKCKFVKLARLPLLAAHDAPGTKTLCRARCSFRTPYYEHRACEASWKVRLWSNIGNATPRDFGARPSVAMGGPRHSLGSVHEDEQ